MIVYAFEYCPDVCDSVYGIISLHKTAKGAYNAMRAHRLNVYNQWRNSMFRKKLEGDKDTDYQLWRIRKLKLEE